MNNLDVINNFIQAAYRKDVPALETYVADNLEFVTLMGRFGKKEFMNFFISITEAMPDLVFSFTNITPEDEHTVSLTFGFTGTATEIFNPRMPGVKPVPASGKNIIYTPEKIYFAVMGTKITRMYPEPGKEGGIVHMFQSAGIKLPPLWLMRLVATLKGLFH